jgi:hypothetical protein
MVVVEGEGAQWLSCQVELASPTPEIESEGGSDCTQNCNTFDPNSSGYHQCIYHTPKLSFANAFSFHSSPSNVSYVRLARPSFGDRLSSCLKL